MTLESSPHHLIPMSLNFAINKTKTMFPMLLGYGENKITKLYKVFAHHINKYKLGIDRIHLLMDPLLKDSFKLPHTIHGISLVCI